MIEPYLIDTVIIVGKTMDEWGETLTTTTTSVKGRVEWGVRLLRNFAGEQTQSSGMVKVAATTTVSHANSVRIENVDYAIVNIVERKDFATRFKEIYLA